MLNYQAPLKDMHFILNEVFETEKVWHENTTLSDTLDYATAADILEECARFASNELFPLNRSGDETGLKFQQGAVGTPAGFKEAYELWAKNGWSGFTGDPTYGGMGMPKTLAMFVEEMLFAANTSFALYPELTGGAIHLISTHAGETLKADYLPKLHAGTWSATMCLTESHCGSDLGLLTTSAVPQQDGTYKISGEKIFISGGEHDLSENIIHLVLARLPDAPEDVKGISLFLVPKFLINKDQECGEKNRVECIGVEHKMGIRAASTCVMRFEEAEGYLIGKPHQGLAVMFSMMNYERLSIAMQGLGLGDISYQTALLYAKERIQGKDLHSHSGKTRTTIIHHGDVRRMLMTMKSFNEGGRAFACYAASWFDKACYAKTSDAKRSALNRLSLLTPVVKAFITDIGFETCVLGQQVLGGHGYICEWGQEQYVRDARIAQIYEGTNGIQSLDLLMRRICADNGEEYKRFTAEISTFLSECQDEILQPLVHKLQSALTDMDTVTQHFIALSEKKRLMVINASACEYLHLFGYVAYAYMWLKMAAVARSVLTRNTTDDHSFYEAKLKTACFYHMRLLPRIKGLMESLLAEEDAVADFSEEMFMAGITA